MRARTVAVLVAGIALPLILTPAGPSWGQNSPAPADAQDASIKPIGKIVGASGAVTVEHVNAVVVQANLSSQPAPVKVGDPVYLGDVVQTGTDGKLAITFADGTAFNISSNARMALNEFVYDPNGKSNSTFFSLTKGTFTFVAGKIAKTGDMKIDTPVATMGIRGTTPHVEIAEDGSAKFTTLIEEGKNKIEQKISKPAVEPHETKPNLQICRGC